MSHLAVFMLVSGLLTQTDCAVAGSGLTFSRGSAVLVSVRSAVPASRCGAGRDGWRDEYADDLARRAPTLDSTRPDVVLPFMAASTLLVVLAQLWRPGRRWVMGVALVMSLLLWGREGGWSFTQGWPLVGALFVGASLGTRGMLWLDGRRRSGAVGVLAASALTSYVLLLTAPASPPTYGLAGWNFVEIGAVASATGVVLVLAFSAMLAPTRVGATIALLGRRSLAIYLAHIFAASGTRVPLSTAGLEHAAIHLVLGSAAGILLPLLLVTVARRPTLACMFDDKPVVNRLAAVVISGERR